VTVTLKQIAQVSGVSVQTVSRVIRGDHGRHDPQTVERVMQAARELNYRPNLLGRALKSGKTHTLGVMRMGVGNYFQLQNIYGMTDKAVELGYQLLTTFENYWRNDHDQTFLKTLDELVGRQVDGLIIIRGMPLEPATCRRLQSLSIPVLWTDWAPPEGAHRLRRDLNAALHILFEHLHGLGHRSVAYFHSPGALHYPGQAISRVERVANEWGIKAQMIAPDPKFDITTPEEIWTHESITRFLNQPVLHDGVTALITGAYQAVPAIVHAVHKAGLRIPDDMSLAALNSTPWCEIVNPPVTGLFVCSEQFGRKAVEKLCRLIDQPQAEPSDELIPVELQQRASTGPVPVRRSTSHVNVIPSGRKTRRTRI